MRISINKIGSLSIHEKKQSLQLKSPMKDIRREDILTARYCQLVIDGKKINCKATSVTGTTKSTNILLKINRSSVLTGVLERYVYTEVECSLLIAERVDFDLYEEVKGLLVEVSRAIGRSAGEILLEVTTFKEGVEGHDDLRFVSNKQLPVVRDKLKKMLNAQNHAPAESTDV